MLTMYNLENPYDLLFVGFTDITNLDWNFDLQSQINEIKSNQLIIYYNDIYVKDDKFMGFKTKKIRSIAYNNRSKEIIIVKKGICISGDITNSGGGMLTYIADKVVNVNYVNGDIKFEYIKERRIK